MKSKTSRTSNYIGNILQVTKDTIKQNKSFYDYYINKDNDLYKKQLPILIQKANMQALAIRKKENEKNLREELFPKTSESIDKILMPLNQIRNAQIRSKKLPPLCPFYNKRGELIRSVVATSKINNKNYLEEDFWNISPKNKKVKILKHHKTENMNNSKIFSINFDNFQKDFFYEEEYANLSYIETEIFGQKEKYLDYIKDKINEFKKSDIKADLFKKEKIFEKNTKKKSIYLNLDSLIVNIYEYSIETENGKLIRNDKPIFEYHLPFDYLPLFYFKGEEKFKIILSQIIKYDSQKDKFMINQNIEKIIKDILKYSSAFNKEEKLDMSNLTQRKSIKDKFSQTFGGKKPLKTEVGNKFNPMNSQTLGGKNFSQTIGMLNPNMYMTNLDNDLRKKIEIISTSDIYPNKIESDYINYNIFEFFWLTSNKYFKICINAPLISVSIPKNNIKVKKFIDFELLFYLIINNFNNWDFYVTKYLCSFKNFRTLLEEINSINECFNKNTYLTPPRIKKYSFNNIEIINIGTIKKRDNLDIIDPLLGIMESKEEEECKDNKNINTKNKPEEKGEKENKLISDNDLQKDENQLINSIFDQKCFMSSIKYIDTKTFKANEYKIYFNFNQFEKIQKMEKYIDKISFFIKFINIDDIKKVVTMDYKSLDNFDENKWIKNYNKYNTQYLKTLENKSTNSSENKKMSIEFPGVLKNSLIQIEIFNPILLAKMFSESGIITNEKKMLTDNYQNKVIKIEKDNILRLSKRYYECLENEEKKGIN